ncbi:multiple epidermal growth factor-like domains protein 6 isoform X2 [Haliotis rubra]|uniref:multiple epidermal growth factor-like domains protein 6 isoform X2 n=1 Tax=Haliotis rubra TaxID=36100 RepID=UPI001EE58E54|nr:multiple epidermal growth factor-like domains protein 6 isoform X2 [Haliotis rubra]
MSVLTNLCTSLLTVSTFATWCHDNQHCSECDITTGYCITDCDRGYYDQRCKSVCSKNCRNKTCEMSSNGNDACTEGCVQGYSGTGCNIPCDSPGGSCTACPGGCDGGYCQLGSSCVSGCVDSYYGNDCKTCSSRCKSCNGSTGQCSECQQSYGGPNCEFSCNHCVGGSCQFFCFQRCIEGFYGIFCSRNCSDTCLSSTVEPPKTNPSSCNWTNGVCIHGCRAGWYGPQCSHRCNTKCMDAACTQTGACKGRCIPGYYGRHCKACPGHCSDLTCRGDDGSCETGCASGFFGEYCNTTCIDDVADVVDMKVNGMKNTTVGINETVTFQCVVQGCPPPDVSLVHTGNTTLAMFRKNNTLYERVIRVHSCSQLGRYSCQATNFTGTSSDKQLHVAELIAIPKKQDVKDCEIETPTDGKDPSGKIKFTLCAYPEPVITKLQFERHDNPKDITDKKKYNLTMDTLMSKLFGYTFTIANIGDEDFGVYTFTVAFGGREVDILIVASQPKDITGITFTSIAIIIGGSLVGVPLVFVGVPLVYDDARLSETTGI